MDPTKKFVSLNIVLAIILVATLVTNQIVMAKIYSRMGKKMASANSKGQTGTSSTSQASGDIMQDAIKFVVSQGVPDIYGSELNVSFNQVQNSMDIMSRYDPTYGKQKITLIQDELGRYIDIGMRISCEYCCGAKSIIFNNGEAACGCAHSQAMRGLAAYLIQKHGSKYSNDEILRELARWKGMYFPKQMIQKMASQLGGAQFTPDTAALLLGAKLPNYGNGENKAPIPSEINNLPSMVGGC